MFVAQNKDIAAICPHTEEMMMMMMIEWLGGGRQAQSLYIVVL
jgi:hypothetical protein